MTPRIVSLCSGYGVRYAVAMPKGQYNRATSRWQPPPKASDPPEFVTAVRAAYESGMTMREVAEHVGTTVKVLQRLMPRHGIPRRPAVIRNQRGAANSAWKGDAATYTALHLRVQSARGRPSHCECCGNTGPGKYEWANKTGRYEDVHDYDRLCCACHRSRDAAQRRLTGRRLTPAHLRGGENV